MKLFSCRTPVVLIILAMAARAGEQPAAPPPPAKYRAYLRYHIDAPRDPHVAQYDAMIEYLQSLDFEFIPPLTEHARTDREDPGKNQLVGLIAANRVLELFRNPSVVSVLLVPVAYEKKPADQLVGVRLELASGFNPARQRELAEQALVLLRQLGFREAIGYDHHGYRGLPFTRLVGSIPAGRLETLLKDLRAQPSGWFAPEIAPAQLPTPLRNVNPITITEVLPDYQPHVEPAVPPARGKEFLDSISPDLWALVNEKGKEATVIRLEVVLGESPPDDSRWRESLVRAAPGLFVENRLGPVITVLARVRAVPGLAALPEVAIVRLPRPARVQVDAAVKITGDNERALRQSGLAKLHEKKFRGQSVRLAIVDTDFRGYQALIDNKRLPPKTRLVDLTTERHPDVYPEPYAGAAKLIGHGCQCALAAALAAPAAELVLIRIDGAAPSQLRQVIGHIHGDLLTEHLSRRQDELTAAAAEFRRDREVLLEERAVILEDFEDERENEHQFGFLGVVRGWIFSQRDLHRQRMAYQERVEKELYEREKRFLKLLQDLRSLKGIAIVSTALVWNDGYPLSGASPLSRWLNEAPVRAPLWFQSAGNTRGQSWAGLFRDVDNNGVMEFAPPKTPLPKGRWTSELNFLGWQPFEMAKSPDLPAGAKLRVSLQWREPHDPDYYPRPGEADSYRQPLTTLGLVLLRQRDPAGKKLPADDFEVVARSAGLPQRLDNHPALAVYEQALEFTVDKAARYALRVERMLGSRWVFVPQANGRPPMIAKLEDLVPTGIRPLGAATLPAFEKTWELYPRLFVDVIDDASRGQGRPIFLDFATDLGSIGIPADSRAVITIGAANLDDRPEPYSAAGPPADLELFKKPDVLAYDALRLGPDGTGGAYGTSLATSFAAGTAAALLSSGMSRAQLVRSLHKQAGKVFRAR